MVNIHKKILTEVVKRVREEGPNVHLKKFQKDYTTIARPWQRVKPKKA